MSKPMTLRERLKQPRPLVVAHRGDWSNAPENSRTAIAAAGAFDMVEIDVRLSADGVPVLMHDVTLRRTTGRLEAVGDLGVAELARTRLLGSTETVPTLTDGLTAAPEHLLFDIDVKAPEDLDTVGAYLSRRPERMRAMLKRDVRDSSDISELLTLEAKHGIPAVAKIVLASEADIALVEDLHSAGVMAAEVWFANAELVRLASATGLPISVYTLDEIACDGFSDALAQKDPGAIWGGLIGMGVRLIMTDVPVDLSSLIASLFNEAGISAKSPAIPEAKKGDRVGTDPA